MRVFMAEGFYKTTYAVEFKCALKEQWSNFKRYAKAAKRREAERAAMLEAKKNAPAPQPAPVSRGWTVKELAHLMTDGPVREEHYRMAEMQLAA